ncbi:MAG: hypothetical protein MSH49_00655 [[Eubacterium] saphenum]|nr:hypothetical protein [[Eubacterium] saphenum]
MGEKNQTNGAIEAIARVLLPKIRQFYQSDEGKRYLVEQKEKSENSKIGPSDSEL